MVFKFMYITLGAFMKINKKNWLIIAAIVIIGFLFNSCEGPAGPGGDPGIKGPKGPPAELELVVSIDIEENIITLDRGSSCILRAAAKPDNATVRTLIWELQDASYGEMISIGGVNGLPIIGESVTLTGLSGGVAKILITAIGTGLTEVTSTITVTVMDLAYKLSLISIDNPQTCFIETVVPNEPVKPHTLFFDGEEVTITIKGSSADHILSLAGIGQMFTIQEGVTLVLENITLQGFNPNTIGAVVLVEAGGTLRMNAGSLITGNVNTAAVTAASVYQGGGVHVTYRAKTDDMPALDGTLELNGGSISNNRSAIGAGVFNRGSVIINSGSISNNAATQTGGNGGGGVFNVGTIDMLGGEISGNTASLGAGVLNNGAVLHIRSGAVISGNIAASEGGGVNNNVGSTLNMYIGSVISGNAAVNGGGVFSAGNADNQAFFNMMGGTFSGNSAVSSGGALFNFSNSTFSISNGVLYGSAETLANRNSAPTGAALTNSGIARHGRFGASDFEVVGNLSTTADTIRVTNGVKE